MKMEFDCTFDIPGEPIAKQRPRMARSGHVYTPSKTKNAEELIGWKYRIANPGVPVNLSDYFSIHVLFAIGGRDKDVDNMIKTVLDALNGVVWADDRQVIQINASKIHVPDGGLTRIGIINEGTRNPYELADSY